MTASSSASFCWANASRVGATARALQSFEASPRGSGAGGALRLLLRREEERFEKLVIGGDERPIGAALARRGARSMGSMSPKRAFQSRTRTSSPVRWSPSGNGLGSSSGLLSPSGGGVESTDEEAKAGDGVR